MAKLTAAKADKYKLYLKSVQCVDADIDFVVEHYKKFNGCKPRMLREDFCGSFAAAAEFVRRSKKNKAIAVDLDGEVLEWGRKNTLPKLKKRKDDLEIIQENVLNVSEPSADVILAMNFSYFLFKEREQLRAYFCNAYRSLADDGVFFLDAYGGTESMDTCEEEKEIDGFNYIWEQHSFNPITSEAVNYIHFKFPDGTVMEKAFEYEWRVWTLREITDLLAEAGFSDVGIYWEGWDDELEEGDGKFIRTRDAENCEGWVCYIVARK
jgi:SAM-dependent methyltransferase